MGNKIPEALAVKNIYYCSNENRQKLQSVLDRKEIS